MAKKKTAIANKHKQKKQTPVRTRKPVTAEVSYAPLPAAWAIAINALKLLWAYRRSFGVLTLVYAVLTFLLVRQLSGGIDVTNMRQEFNTLFGTDKTLSTSAAIFATLLTTGSSSGELGAAYQWILLIIVSLAIIWALRLSKAGDIWRVKDAFYKGMHPLIPFILVLMVVAAELLPFLIGATLYGFISGSAAISFIEKLPWFIVVMVLAAVSMYLLVTSLVAVYAVTLPDMTPLQALRSAKQLVTGRRLAVLRKILFLPMALLIIFALIVLPAILILPAIAQWLYFALSMVALVVIHAYMYELYRQLLIETDV